MAVKDQTRKPQSTTRNPPAHFEPVLRIVTNKTDVDYDMVTRWISLADQALRNNLDSYEEA